MHTIFNCQQRANRHLDELMAWLSKVPTFHTYYVQNRNYSDAVDGINPGAIFLAWYGENRDIEAQQGQ